MPRQRKGPKGGSTTVTAGGMERTVFYPPQEIKRKLRKLAAERDMAVSTLLLEIVEDWLDQQPKVPKK